LDLVVIDGLTPAEAGEVLGITQVTVRVRLHRARRALRAASARLTANPDSILEVAP
jgi:RNA polymerase sigma-70 factor (ECF subfamily)